MSDSYDARYPADYVVGGKRKIKMTAKVPKKGTWEEWEQCFLDKKHKTHPKVFMKGYERQAFHAKDEYIAAIEKALLAHSEVNGFYADEENYDKGSDTPNSAGAWKLSVGQNLGVTGSEFIDDCGIRARETRAEFKELIKQIRGE